jgi:hypothetical protein
MPAATAANDFCLVDVARGHDAFRFAVFLYQSQIQNLQRGALVPSIFPVMTPIARPARNRVVYLS